jgi:F0F1-type ATP synthase delta subunit
MGGVSVRIGDTILDGTVRSQIERLREQLINTTGALVAL